MKKLVSAVRGWFYRHSRKAQTDCIEAAMYDCTHAIVDAIACAVDADAPRPSPYISREEARRHLARIQGDTVARTVEIRRRSLSAAAGTGELK